MDTNISLEAALQNSGVNLTPEQIAQITAAAQKNAWHEQLERDPKTGRFLTSPQNYMIFFNNEPQFKDKLRFNEIKRIAMFGDRAMTDSDRAVIFNTAYEFFKSSTVKNFDTALEQVINEHRFNPIRDYLEGLMWDGVPRIETMFIDWLGADDNNLTRQMTKKWLIAGVKRVLIPGCQFDNILVLQCANGGGGKTTMARRLGLYFDEINEDNYYQELSSSDVDNPQRTAEALNEGWIVAFDELDGLNKKDVNNIKTFLSRTEEKVRMAYARYASTNKRHCVFIGSTNESGFLKDYSSSVERRFWIIPVTKTFKDSNVFHGFTKDVVDQIWAEAYAEYMANPRISLDIDYTLYDELAERQKEFKSYNNDIDVEFYREIFDRKFVLNDKLEFASEDSFIQQMNNTFPETPNVEKQYLVRIPAKWVKKWAMEQHISYKGHGYLAAAMDVDFKTCKYNGSSVACFQRKNAPDFRQQNIKTFDSSTLLIPGLAEFEV